MRRSGIDSGRFVAVVGLLAVLTAGAPVPSTVTPSPSPSLAVSASSSPAPSVSPTPTPTPAPDPEVSAPSAMGAMDAGATGSIEVTVTVWSTGATPTGGCVDAVDSTGTIVGTSCTGVNGVYTVVGVPEGLYTVRAYNFTGMAEMWFGPALTRTGATAVAVVSNDVAPISVKVLSPTSAAGRVVDAGGQPVVDATVEEFMLINELPVETVTTDAQGWYVIGLCAMQCKVRASSPTFAAEWYPGGSNAAAATVLTTPGPQLLAAMVLDTTVGSIAGTLAPPSTYTGATTCAQLFEYWGAGNVTGMRYVGMRCGDVGTPYTFENLAPTTYRICYVYSPGTAHCASATWHNMLGSDAAPTPIVVTSGATTTVPGFGTTLTVSGQYSYGGPTLYMNTGCVDFYDTTSAIIVGTVCRPADAIYSLTVSDDAHAYRAYGWGFTGRSDGWVATGLSVVDGVPAFAGSLSTGLTAGLGNIWGTITLPQGTSAAQGCVRALNLDPRYAGSPVVAEECADSVTGQYHLTPPAGQYKLEFFTYTGDVATQFNGGALTVDAAATLTVSASYAGFNVDAALAPSGFIEASLVDADGEPVTAGCVTLFTAAGRAFDSRCIEEPDLVTFDSMPAGTYRLHFDGTDDAAAAWFGGDSYEAAMAYSVTARATTEASLIVTGTGFLSGTAAVSGGLEAVGGCVTAYAVDTLATVAQACDLPSGQFSLSVPAGDYLLGFSGWVDASDVAQGDAWYGGTDSSTALVVSVGVGGDTVSHVTLGSAGLLLVLPALQSANYPTNPKIASGGCVDVYLEGGGWVSTRCADAPGELRFSLPAGRYSLYASGFSIDQGTFRMPLRAGWSTGAGGWSAVTGSTYVVGTGTSTSVQFGLPQGVEFFGTATASGHPATAGLVDVYENGTYLTTVALSDSGTFSVPDLAWGSKLRLFFRDVPGAAQQFEDGTATLFASQPLWLQTAPIGDQTRVSYSFDLVQGGSLTGPLMAPMGLQGDTLCVTLASPYAGTYYYYGDSVCGARGGVFEMHDILPGAYAVIYSDADGNELWWDADGTWSGNSSVSITAGATTTLTARVNELSGTSVFVAGQTVTLRVTTFPATTEVGSLWQSTDGVNWSQTPKQVSVVGGVGSVAVQPTTGTYFAVLLPSGMTNAWRIDPTLPTVTLTGSAPLEQPGSAKQVTVSVSPSASGLAEVWTQSVVGGPWVKSTQTVQVTNGSAVFTVRPQGWMSVRVVLLGGQSNAITFTPVTPAVTLSGSASFVAPGTAQTATVTASPGWSGVAELWVQTAADGPWVKSAKTVQLTNGTGSFTVYPSSWTSMKVVFMGVTSSRITFTPIAPTVTLTGSASFVQPGTALPVTLSVSPSASGVAELWVQSEVGGPWVKSAQTVQVTNGVGALTLNPSRWTSLRVVVFGVTSDPVTFTPVTPVVTLSGPTSFTQPGSAQRVTVAVSPSMSGIAEVWVQSAVDGPWVKSAMTVQVTNGAGSLTMNPSTWASIRVVLFGASSDPFTFTPVVPVVTLSGPTSFIQPGSSQRVTVAVSPSISGVAEVWFQSQVDGPWEKSAMTVTVTNGSGSLTLSPSTWTSVRLVLFGTPSNALTFTPVVPVVTLSGSASFTQPGSAQRVSVSVAPSISGVAEVWFQSLVDGPWVKSAMTVTVTNGSGSLTLSPSTWTSVRVVLNGTSSDPVTFTPISPVVTLSGSASFSQPGSAQQVTVAVDHGVSGVAELWVQGTIDGPWVKSGATVTVIDGAGSTTLYPSRWMSVRVVLFGTTSDPVTFAPTTPGP